MRTRIVGARIVTPTGVREGDLVLDDETGRIVSLGGDEPYTPNEHLVDAGGAWAVPGGVDPHVHFGGFGPPAQADDFETGSRGALAGGTTTVMDFCEPAAGETAAQVIARRMADAEPSLVDYAFHFVLTEDYERLLADLDFIEEGVGIRDYKLFTVYDNTTLTRTDLERILSRLSGDQRRSFLVHAEDAGIIAALRAEVGDSSDFSDLARTRPAAAEVAVASLLRDLAERHGVRVCIAHASAAGTAGLLDRPVSCGAFELETCPHYLELDEGLLGGEDGALYTMTPPLRGEADREALWAAVLDGSLGMLSTDHCPYSRADKRGATYQTVPCGVDGVQVRMMYAFSEGVCRRGLTMDRFVDLTSARAARFYGMWPRKGALLAGSDADVVLVSPEGETVCGMDACASALDYSVWEGRVLSGRIERVFKGGREVVGEDGSVCAERGSGRFLRR